MQSCHIKKNDTVVVIAGVERGKRGRVIEVLPKKQRAIVEGLKMIKRHTKQRQSQNAPQGGIIEREGTIHVSNLMEAAKFDARAAKRGGVAAPAQG